MTKTSATEISEYQTVGFVVLRKRIDHTLVRMARITVAERMEAMRKTEKGNDVFATVYEDKDWPHECKTLFEAIESRPHHFVRQTQKSRYSHGLASINQPTESKAGRLQGQSSTQFPSKHMCRGQICLAIMKDPSSKVRPLDQSEKV
ncbi:MAG: hypothetical protein M1840_007595 [Geoglossum simile]|nr:MAG: hypothetical protein M1840_007595 [Geoglossum simile]